ncbi:MAG: hypothetical protein MJK08_03295 [Campylobacterales bacterium]|nr:hypothetical protein [Campylobacterales bacterium]NQY53265.1 hypothetical protein [Campylobacteraceae bacterium]
MFKKILLTSVLVLSAHAHTALMTCFDNGDDTITCEGGFSSGASGSGISIYIKVNEEKVINSIMNEDSEFTFTKPKEKYLVTFDAGKGHIVKISSEDIVE